MQEQKILLSSILAQGRPIEVREDTLVLRFTKDPQFCVEVLEMPDCQRVLAEALQAAFGARLNVTCVNGTVRKTLRLS